MLIDHSLPPYAVMEIEDFFSRHRIHCETCRRPVGQTSIRAWAAPASRKKFLELVTECHGALERLTLDTESYRTTVDVARAVRAHRWFPVPLRLDGGARLTPAHRFPKHGDPLRAYITPPS